MHPFDTFKTHEYLNLKTFRKSGQAVPTPVWFAQSEDGTRLYVTTMRVSGKAKRIHNSGSVEIAPCDQIGNLLGDWQPAHAAILAMGENRETAKTLLFKKYEQTEMMQKLTQAPDDGSRIYIEVIAAPVTVE